VTKYSWLIFLICKCYSQYGGVPAFFGGALSLGFFVLRQKTQGGEVRTLPVFLDFLILFSGGMHTNF
jgi:hypothetical protein